MTSRMGRSSWPIGIWRRSRGRRIPLPSLVYERGGRWVARLVSPAQTHLGTFGSREAAREAVETARSMVVPEVRRRRARAVVPSEALVLELAEAAGPLRGFVLTAAFCGARLFEVAALRVEDVALPTLRIRCGKNGRARDVVLFEPALSEVRAPATGLLFRNERGGIWTRQAVNKRWIAMLKEVGCRRDLQFRDLRRFHATWLLDRGVSDLDVAVQLGHFDRKGRPNPELVREVYGHPSKREALGRLRELTAAVQ